MERAGAHERRPLRVCRRSGGRHGVVAGSVRRHGRDPRNPPRPAPVALVGVATVLGKGDPSAILTEGFNTGDLLMLGAVLGWVAPSGRTRVPHRLP